MWLVSVIAIITNFTHPPLGLFLDPPLIPNIQKIFHKNYRLIGEMSTLSIVLKFPFIRDLGGEGGEVDGVNIYVRV